MLVCLRKGTVESFTDCSTKDQTVLNFTFENPKESWFPSSWPLKNKQ